MANPQFSTVVSGELKAQLDEIAKAEGLSQKELLADYIKLKEAATLRGALAGRADDIDNFHSLLEQIEISYNNSLKINLNQKNIIRNDFAVRMDALTAENAALHDSLKAANSKIDELTEKEKIAAALADANAALKDQITTLKDQIDLLKLTAQKALQEAQDWKEQAVLQHETAKDIEAVADAAQEKTAEDIDALTAEKPELANNDKVKNIKARSKKPTAKKKKETDTAHFEEAKQNPPKIKKIEIKPAE